MLAFVEILAPYAVVPMSIVTHLPMGSQAATGYRFQAFTRLQQLVLICVAMYSTYIPSCEGKVPSKEGNESTSADNAGLLNRSMFAAKRFPMTILSAYHGTNDVY